MAKSEMAVIDRRMAIGGALAVAAGLALPHRQSRPVTQRGIVGGGLAQFGYGEANFSFIATRMEFPEDEPDVVVGSVIWVDDEARLTLRSTSVTEYIVPAVQPEHGVSRHLIGTMSVNDADEYPFELEVVDAELPGTKGDLANLKVGDGARTSEHATPASGLGYSYVANGTVATGDIQELDVKINMATGEVQPAED